MKKYGDEKLIDRIKKAIEDGPKKSFSKIHEKYLNNNMGRRVVPPSKKRGKMV